MPTPVISLTFQRRHKTICRGGHPVKTLTAEVEERRKGFARCDCPIYASGTLNGVFYRLATKQLDWEAARQVAQPYLDAGSWTLDRPVTPPPAPVPVPEAVAPGAPSRPLTPLDDAIERSIKAQKNACSAEKTVNKYKTVLRGDQGLAAFAASRGARYVEEVDMQMVRDLSDSWAVTPSTRRNKLSILKPFFERFVEDGIIPRNPARFRLIVNRAMRTPENFTGRIPFTDPELTRMFDGCQDYGHTELREWPKKKDGRQVVAISEYRDYARKFTGEDVADFMEVSVSTGMRFMDVATFHVDRLTAAGEVKLRAAKNGAWISVVIPEYLRKVIRERARRFGPYIFGDPRGRKPHYVYLCWRNRLEALWEQTGPWEHKPVHHRFRHTFVRQLLERGTPVSIVAELIGDSEETVRKHYANWVPERQAHISKTLREIQAHAPRFRREA